MLCERSKNFTDWSLIRYALSAYIPPEMQCCRQVVEIVLHSHRLPYYSRNLNQTTAKVLCVYFVRIELAVKLVFEVKSAVEFLSPNIYD